MPNTSLSTSRLPTRRVRIFFFLCAPNTDAANIYCFFFRIFSFIVSCRLALVAKPRLVSKPSHTSIVPTKKKSHSIFQVCVFCFLTPVAVFFSDVGCRVQIKTTRDRLQVQHRRDLPLLVRMLRVRVCLWFQV